MLLYINDECIWWLNLWELFRSFRRKYEEKNTEHVHFCIHVLFPSKSILYFKIMTMNSILCLKYLVYIMNAPYKKYGMCYPGHLCHIGLIQVKEEGWAGFSKGWQGCSSGFPLEQPCQPPENPPNLFEFTFFLK